MPELMVDLITSLDGYASAEGWPGWWGLEGPEYLAWLEEDQPEGGYLTLMGANTYRVMSQMSTDAAGGGDFRPEESDSLTGLDAVPKVVFSSTLTEPLAWPNARLVTTDAVEAVRTMKTEGDLPAVHAGQRPAVPLPALRWPGRPVPAGRLPRHHRCDGCRTGLRRLPRRRARTGREPHLRRALPAARLRAAPPGRPARQRLSPRASGALSAVPETPGG